MAAGSAFRYDVFLTHDWGTDEEGRDNHQRVVYVGKKLKALGLRVWIDENEMTGDIVAQMSKGIEESATVAVFVTQRYNTKVSASGSDNCKMEFAYANRTHEPEQIIPVVMDKGMRDTKRWTGQLGFMLGGLLYVDGSEDLDQAIVKLAAEVAKRMALPSRTMAAPSESEESGDPSPSSTPAVTEASSGLTSAEAVPVSTQQLESSQASTTGSRLPKVPDYLVNSRAGALASKAKNGASTFASRAKSRAAALASKSRAAAFSSKADKAEP